MNFLLSTFLALSHKFVVCCIFHSLNSKYFLIFLVIFLWLMGYLIVCYLCPGWCGSVDWVRSMNWKVIGSIPSQGNGINGTCLDWGPGPHLGAWKRQLNDVPLPLFLPPPLSKNKYFKKCVIYFYYLHYNYWLIYLGVNCLIWSI